MNPNPHNREKKPSSSEEEDEDPVDRYLNKSGCADLHFKVQECMVDYKDWRKCQDHVKAFKNCIDKTNKNVRQQQQ